MKCQIGYMLPQTEALPQMKGNASVWWDGEACERRQP
jgi:hypothetical protein